MNTNNHRVWKIIGTSQGFGRELVRAALQRGDSVIATSRNDPAQIDGAVQAVRISKADSDLNPD